MSTEFVVQEILTTVRDMLPRLVELFKEAGGRDAFITAIDTGLAAARSRTDADLARKHGRQP